MIQCGEYRKLAKRLYYSYFLKNKPSDKRYISFWHKKDAAECKAAKSNWIINTSFPLH